MTDQDFAPNSEDEIQAMVRDHLLREHGVASEQNVRTDAGRADIVTADTLYEVKTFLTRPEFYKAIGQVLLYRQATDPSMRAVVVGLYADPIPVDVANALGIHVWFCDLHWRMHQIQGRVLRLAKGYPFGRSIIGRALRALAPECDGDKGGSVVEICPCQMHWREQLGGLPEARKRGSAC